MDKDDFIELIKNIDIDTVQDFCIEIYLNNLKCLTNDFIKEMEEK